MPKIIIHQVLDSTMLEMARALERGELSDFDAVMALRQTAGQGRLQRSWHTGAGKNLAVSFWVPLEPDRLPPLPLTAALAVIDTLSGAGLAGQLRCKWPNDIKVRDRKICGILCRYAENARNTAGSIVGIGVNLDLSGEEIEAIDQPVTSLKTLTGRGADPRELCSVLQNRLESRVSALKRDGFADMAAEWYGLCGHADREISVDTGFAVITGRTKGIDGQGALLLDCGGTERRIICGDVANQAASLRRS